MGVALHVRVMKNGQLLSEHQFDSDVHRTIKIGRLPSAQLKIEDPKVSRIHAVIEFVGGDISIIDMGSSVGTVVNGAKVHKTKLSPGDQVALGDVQLMIGVGAGALAVAAPPVILLAMSSAPRPVAAWLGGRIWKVRLGPWAAATSADVPSLGRVAES